MLPSQGPCFDLRLEFSSFYEMLRLGVGYREIPFLAFSAKLEVQVAEYRAHPQEFPEGEVKCKVAQHMRLLCHLSLALSRRSLNESFAPGSIRIGTFCNRG